MMCKNHKTQQPALFIFKQTTGLRLTELKFGTKNCVLITSADFSIRATDSQQRPPLSS